MKPVAIIQICQSCNRKYLTDTGTFKLEDSTKQKSESYDDQSTESETQLASPDFQDITPERLSLEDWSVFSEKQNLLTPQQVESIVCNWLQNTAISMQLLGGQQEDSENRGLYGKIVFDQLGEIYDFEICKLSIQMLSLGFDNWINTLASGELLLDIVNCLISQCTTDDDSDLEFSTSPFAVISSRKLPVRRMLNTAPNKHAICSFLLNHSCLVENFLDPILAIIRDIGLPPPGTKPGTVGNIRQALHLVKPVGHNLLHYTFVTREWTWKALMLLVMILMSMIGDMHVELEPLFSALAGEFYPNQLIVPELQKAMRVIRESNPQQLKNQLSLQELRCALPNKRVMKQGAIEFKSVLYDDFATD